MLHDAFTSLLRALNVEIPEKSTKAGREQLKIAPDGKLPIVFDTSIMLHKGETCHFSSSATRLIPKNKVVGYAGGNAGVSFRVAKGVTLRTGSTRGQQIRKDVLESHSGKFIITNKRIIFSSTTGSFDKKIENLSLVTPADDGICLQFGSQNFLIEVKNSDLAFQIIEHIVQNG